MKIEDLRLSVAETPPSPNAPGSSPPLPGGLRTRARTTDLRFLAMAAILVVATVLRLRHLGRDSLWYDEAFTIALATPPLNLKPHALWPEQVQPLYHGLLSVWIRAFGNSEVAVRLLSALAGIAGVWLIYRVGARRFGWAAGAAAAAMLALSPFQLEYAIEARPYTLLVLMSLASCALFLRVLETDARAPAIGYVLATAGLLHTHLYGVFPLVAQYLVYAGAWLAARRVPGREEANGSENDARSRACLACPPARWAVLQAGVLVVSAPWLALVAAYVVRAETKGFWLHPFGPEEFFRAYWTYVGSATGVALVAGLAVLGLAWARQRGGGAWTAAAMFAALAVVPVAIPVAASLVTKPLFMPRYGIPAAAGLFLLAGAGVAAMRPPMLRAAVLAAAVALPLLRLDPPPTGGGVGYVKPQWREAGAYLQQNLAPGDVVAINNPFAGLLYNYYVDRPDVELRPFDSAELPVDPANPPRRLWVVVHEPTHPLERMIPLERWRITGGATFRKVYVFRLEPAAPPRASEPSAAAIDNAPLHNRAHARMTSS